MKVQTYQASNGLQVGSFIRAFSFDDPTKQQYLQVVKVEGSDAICLLSIETGLVKLKEIHDGGQPIKDINAFTEALGLYFGAKATYEVLHSITLGG